MLMNLPKEYFVLLDSKDYPKSSKPPVVGAQRVGFDWYIFADTDALSRMLNDGVFSNSERSCEECSDKDGEIDTLQDDLRASERALFKANEENERLEREIEKLKKGKSND